jgi:TPR repeat protein
MHAPTAGFARRWAVGPEQDPTKAAELFQRAADLGDPEGMRHLADAHADGQQGVPRDVRRAFQLYCEAALRGSSDALTRLFNLLLLGVTTSGPYAHAAHVAHDIPHDTR